MKESGKENDRRPVYSVKGSCEKKRTRGNCDVGFDKDRTSEVAEKTEALGFIYICCK